MAGAAIKMLTTQVDGLSAMPAGAQRSAACSRPRRLMWEVLFGLQSSIDALRSQQAGSFWKQCQVQEVLESCEALGTVLSTLQSLDLESRSSSWVLTDYTVLTKEIATQRETAQRLLSGEDDLDPRGPDDDDDDQVLATRVESSDAKVVILEVNDIEDYLYPCGWTEDKGDCKEGCEVGNCKFRKKVVESETFCREDDAVAETETFCREDDTCYTERKPEGVCAPLSKEKLIQY
mmetsp:Transcript_137295/g.256370  ORF Transcript_137295/g.256370 Transcript_137295/m.256370 type:complete len:234 (+) Transcript_137295:67-768(+)